MATTFAELFGAVFPTEAQTETGVTFGPTGADYTGTFEGGGSGDATLANQETIIAAIAALNDFDPATDTVLLANGVHGGSAATLALKSLSVIATDTNSTAVVITGVGTGNAITATGGDLGRGVVMAGAYGGLRLSGGGLNGAALDIAGDNVGIKATGLGTPGFAVYLQGTTYDIYYKAEELQDAIADAVGSTDISSVLSAIAVVDGIVDEILVDTGTTLPTQIAGISGGGASITVVPLTGVVESRVDGTTINAFTGETPTIAIAVVDAAGVAVDVSALTLSIVIEMSGRTDVVTIADGSITKVTSTISFALPSGATDTEGLHRWSLRQSSDNGVLMQGPFIVTYSPDAD